MRQVRPLTGPEKGWDRRLSSKTYRQHGHFQGDPQTYKPKAEIKEWLKKDPIPRFRNKLIEMGIFTGDDAEKISLEIKVEIDEAVAFALASPYPLPKEA